MTDIVPATPACPPPWFVYLLLCADGTLYAGITTDLDRRLAEHNAGVGARYTRGRLPVRLAYAEEAVSRSAAARRERCLKRLPASRKRDLTSCGAPHAKTPGLLPA